MCVYVYEFSKFLCISNLSEEHTHVLLLAFCIIILFTLSQIFQSHAYSVGKKRQRDGQGEMKGGWEGERDRETGRKTEHGEIDTQRMTRNIILSGLQWVIERKEEEIFMLRLSS